LARSRRFVAVDLGASSGRVLAGDWDGARFHVEEIHRFDNDPVHEAGHLHWDAAALWTEIKRGLARCAGGATGPVMSGVGIDTWGVDYALLNREGELLGNPFHYRDRRTDGVMDLVFDRVPRSDLYRATGIQPMQINTLVQLFSMVRDRDPQLADAATLLPLPNLFSYWLCGHQAAEYTHATTTQCLDVLNHRWAVDLMKVLDIPTDIFPPLVEPGTVLGTLPGGLAAEVGMPAATPVVAVGSHDTASAVAAIPGLDARSAYISSGTWSLMGVLVGEPVIGDLALAGGFTNEGGVGGTIRLLRNIPGLWLVQECRRRWEQDGANYDWAELIELAERAEPLRCIVDPDDPTLLNPTDMPAAIRAACRRSGEKLPHSAGAVIRCCLESVALSYRATLDDLQTLIGRRLEAIRIVGGGSRNALLCQLTADACDRPVVAGPVESTALGNLMVQAVAAGEIDDLDRGRAAVAASTSQQTYEPHSCQPWEEALARFRRISANPAKE
jgi:rhamnulokinase